MEVRPARLADGPSFLELVHNLAQFEKLTPPTSAACERLLRDAFAEPAPFQLWVAEGEMGIIAYAVWFLTYSTFRAKPSLYLEDLFVHPKARQQGVAQTIMAALQQEAHERGCGRFEWSVLDWNTPAIKLYEKLGAKPLKGWQMMRLDLADEDRCVSEAAD